MKTVSPRVMSITAIIVIFCIVLWVAALFVGYLVDDKGSPAADERSVPAPRLY